MSDWLAQIAASPDDDAPRLVYADALSQDGDPRGELIAVQCALAREEATDEPVGDVARLISREHALLKKHAATWSAVAREITPGWGLGFRRGFIEELDLGHHGFDGTLATRLLAAEPLIRALKLGCRDVRTLVECEEVAAVIAELALSDHHWLDRVAAALHASELPRLRRIRYEKISPDEPTALSLVEVPQALVDLELGFDGRLASVPSNFLDRLVACPARQHLERLTIRQLRHLGTIGRPLAKLPRLRAVVLENAGVTIKGMYALAELPSLESLDVSANYSKYDLVNVDLAKVLELAPNLRHLRLNKLGLGVKQARALASSPAAARLTRLDLARNELDDDGADAIATSEHLRNLRRLNLNANGISATAIERVRSAPTLRDTRIQIR